MAHLEIVYFKHSEEDCFKLNDGTSIIRTSDISALQVGDVIVKFLKKDVRQCSYDELLENIASARKLSFVSMEVFREINPDLIDPSVKV